MLSRFLSGGFSSLKKTSLTAHKYMKSVTETALLYKPEKTINLVSHQNIKDRVVQAFFDSSNIHISVTEADQRLTDVHALSTPSHSFYQINLPFKNNPNLRKKMTQFSSSTIRVGRLFEIMDYIAANVAYRYCTPDNDKDLDMNDLDFIIVTAAIDQIEFYYPISIEIDCILSGYVSYVGKSSMEVHIDVLQKFDNEERLACSANFVMVAKNKATGASYTVPKLSLEKQTEIFRIINELGQERQVDRKNASRRALEMAPPTYQESVIIHKLMQSLKSGNQKYRPISSTTMKNTMLMHVEDKNLSGKVFGGLILRYGYELGWLCATKFLGTALPVISLVDEVQFLAPVEIGSYIELQANIGYVTDRFLHVIVTCHNWQLTGTRRQTNLLHITFQHREEGEITKVYPQSLTESYVYIQSLRRVHKVSHIQP